MPAGGDREFGRTHYFRYKDDSRENVGGWRPSHLADCPLKCFGCLWERLGGPLGCLRACVETSRNIINASFAACTNDVDADDDNNNKNNSMTTQPVVVPTLLVLWIVPVDVPD